MGVGCRVPNQHSPCCLSSMDGTSTVLQLTASGNVDTSKVLYWIWDRQRNIDGTLFPGRCLISTLIPTFKCRIQMFILQRQSINCNFIWKLWNWGHNWGVSSEARGWYCRANSGSVSWNYQHSNSKTCKPTQHDYNKTLVCLCKPKSFPTFIRLQVLSSRAGVKPTFKYPDYSTYIVYIAWWILWISP